MNFDEKGQAITEYAIIGLVIVSIIVSGVSIIRVNDVNTKLDDVSSTQQEMLENMGGRPSVAKEPIKIGLLLPLTGAVPVIGEDDEKGVRAWKAHNDEIMGRPVEILIRDSGADPEQTISKYKEIKGKVDIMGGMVSSHSTLSLMPYLAEDERVFLDFGARSWVITGQKFQKSGGWMFRPYTNNTWQIAQEFIKIINKEFPEAKTMTHIGPDYAWGHDMWKCLKIAAENTDLEIIEAQWPEFGARDFAPFIRNVMKDNPDIVTSSLYGDDLITFVKQAKGYNFFERTTFIDSDISWTEMRVLGDAIPEAGFWGTPAAHWYTLPVGPKGEDVNEWCLNNLGTYLGAKGQGTYGCLDAMKAAIEKAGSTDQAEIREAMEGLTFSTPWHERVGIRELDHQGMFTVPYGKFVYSEAEGKPVLTKGTLVDLREISRTLEQIESY